MQIIDYVNCLLEIYSEHGNLEVQTYDHTGTRVDAVEPVIAYKRILKLNAHKNRFWYDDRWKNSFNDKGEKVVRV